MGNRGSGGTDDRDGEHHRMKAVVNATPLIGLARVDQLAVLIHIFDGVLVPPSVYDEVTGQGRHRPGALQIAQTSWIQVQAPTVSGTIEPLLLGLDHGEMQVLLLAREVQPAWVVMDERLGRRVAQAMQLPLIGTVGVLLAAVRGGVLAADQAIDTAHQMVRVGIRISPALVAWLEQEVRSGV